MCIANLPPHIRMNVEYLLLGGVWLGPVKPQMSVVLTPILRRINNLLNLGIPLQTPLGPRTLRAKLLLGVFDLPAKALALNCLQYNGHYGCAYCLDRGTYTSHRRLYLPTDEHTPRSHSDIKQWATQAEEQGEPIFGVKGPSVLSPFINIVTAVPVDYMHAVLEGVVKSLLGYWFASKNHKYRFYLGTQVKAIDRKLLRIKPPHDFRRSPRPIETTVKFWKASEYRAFLLFYAVPVLSGFLPRDHLHHLSLLVSSMHILLATKISPSDLAAARHMLKRFYQLVPQLYPETLCTLNVHTLIHLCDCVQRWGPLWCYSAFGFENLHGYMRKHCHGTRNVLPQLIHAVQTRQALPNIQNGLESTESGRTLSFLQKFTKTKSEERVLGRITHRELCAEDLHALEAANFPVVSSTVPVFKRYKHSLGVLHSRDDECKFARNSSICLFRYREPASTHEQIGFGSIRTLCFTGTCGVPVAIVRLFQGTGEDVLGPPPTSYVSKLRSRKINAFVFKVKKLSVVNQVIAISTSAIVSKCVHIPIKHSPVDFIVIQPNFHEHH